MLSIVVLFGDEALGDRLGDPTCVRPRQEEAGRIDASAGFVELRLGARGMVLSYLNSVRMPSIALICVSLIVPIVCLRPAEAGLKEVRQQLNFGKAKPTFTCSSLTQVCLKRNAGSAKCGLARADCMRNGVFVGPQGARFKDVAQR
jgi:hypothetical protein